MAVLEGLSIHTRLFFFILLAQVQGRAVESPQCSWRPHPFPSGFQVCPPQVDLTGTGSFAPWSHPPACLGQIISELPEFCVFTDTAFRGGRGISILTSPDVAAAMASSLDDGIVPQNLRQHPSSTMSAGGDAPVRVEDISGRGKGTVAARRFRQWEVIMVDFPALIAQNEYPAISNPNDIRELLEQGVSRLPEAQRERVLGLARSGSGDVIQDILKTNVFGGVAVGGVSHIGLFPVGSRVNHNCRPNTFWRYDPITMAQEVIAMRDIKAGEELSHSYTSLGLTYKLRRRALEGWGFNCTCELCAADPEHIAQSDLRRHRLAQIHEEMESYTVGEKYVDDRVEELTYLIEKEEMWPLFTEYYTVASRAYLSVRRPDKARRYARIADEAWHAYGGENHDGVDEMRQLWSDINQREPQLSEKRK